MGDLLGSVIGSLVIIGIGVVGILLALFVEKKWSQKIVTLAIALFCIVFGIKSCIGG